MALRFVMAMLYLAVVTVVSKIRKGRQLRHELEPVAAMQGHA
jgi:hypothetical protein